MGSSLTFPEIFAAEPGAATGVPFVRFMELALYHPEVGYYTRRRRRVGLDRKADFFTATTFNPVFGELVVDAAVRLLGPVDPKDYELVEIGAEPQGGAFKDIAHPFRGYRTISYGQPVDALAGKCVVFSNELFDAQPCHRVVWRRGAWRELGVALTGETLAEVELPAFSPELAAWAERLPPTSTEDYHIDLPLRTVPLLQKIIAPDWRGLFLAFDYGKSWAQLVEDCPAGTARTYSHQKQRNDLLLRPGHVDLTFHVCWDWLVDTLQFSGFGQALVESHEAFFAKRASGKLQEIMTAEARGFSRRKQSLIQLLHPANMGQKFQALHALRD